MGSPIPTGPCPSQARHRGVFSRPTDHHDIHIAAAIGSPAGLRVEENDLLRMEPIHQPPRHLIQYLVADHPYISRIQVLICQDRMVDLARYGVHDYLRGML